MKNLLYRLAQWVVYGVGGPADAATADDAPDTRVEKKTVAAKVARAAQVADALGIDLAVENIVKKRKAKKAASKNKSRRA